MKPPVGEFLMIVRCRENHEKYQYVTNGKGMVTELDNEIMTRLLTKEVEKESYDYYANHFAEYSQDDLHEFSKSLEKSAAARLEGNKLLLEKKHDAKVHEKIWRFYSKSVALAPPDSEELALAYANRSYLFLHIGQFEESIKDIKRAIDLTHSEVLKLKLLCRKMTCLAGLKDSNSQKSTWKSIKILFDTMDAETVRDHKLTKLVEKAQGVMTSFNSSAPQLPGRHILPPHNLVSLKNGENGEYLVAARDIEPGEPVLTFRPYVLSTNPNKFYAYCSHCFSVMWASIPCNNCSLCMFCSDECKTEAWQQYHEVECKILPHMQIELLFYLYYQMAVRSLIMAVKEAGSLTNLLVRIEKLSDQVEENPMGHRNIGRTGFMNLYNAPVNLRFEMFLQSLGNVSLILNLFIQTTDFYDGTLRNLSGKELARDQQVMSSAVLILKLMCLAFSHNFVADRAGGDYCIDGKSGEDCSVQRCCPRGALLVPDAYRVKSACNPNTFKFIKEYEGKLIYIAYRPIKKGDMITAAKYGLFYQETLKMRKSRMEFFSSKCDCRACIEDWPRLDEYIKDPLAPEAPLIPLILPTYEEIFREQAKDRNYQPPVQVLENLKEDIRKAYHVTEKGPTFLTSMLMEYLFSIICRRYSIRQPNVSETCYS